MELIVILVLAGFGFVPFLSFIAYWRTFERAGRPPVLSLLTLIPLVGTIVLFWFAFAMWPIEEEVKRLRSGPIPPIG